MADDVEIIVSDAHLDPSVKTGVPEKFYRSVPMIRLFGRRMFLQVAPSMSPLLAKSVVVDLNPRSLSAWLLLIGRRLLHKRTLVWGHIFPQAGPASKTAFLRLTMRKLSNGTISYTYTDRVKALLNLPGSPVWVAPNSLYKLSDMESIPHETAERFEVTYVGRFAPAKKVDLLVRGFALAARTNQSIRLRLIGGGEEEGKLRALVDALAIADLVKFDGWVDGAAALRIAYSTSFCSVSPGFAGLGLTQSLGFGIPMLVADDEQHSPEIELADSGGVRWFASNSPESLAESIEHAWRGSSSLPDEGLAVYTRERYSAEAMAAGLVAALAGTQNYVPTILDERD
ncbi:glycosyltransferase [Pseudarthrobacter albicanus]|uniref:glycosyltransferase n=1 Tax=Pseudarthrobacter albicanus TaxID=2823873 RepID=UPI001BA872AB|nr:glycosyltransferase [Pseudarthrobacter albicanus]